MTRTRFICLRVSLILLVTGVWLSGCRYDRLLAFKNSLKDPANFSSEYDPAGGLRIRFRHPIVMPDDVRFLGYPSGRETANGSDELTWSYDFRPATVNGSPDHSPLPVTLSFHEGRLAEIVFPDAIARMVPSALPTVLLARLGAAKISLRDRRLEFSTEATKTTLVALPTRTDVTSALGPGAIQSLDRGLVSHTYSFECDTPHGSVYLRFVAVFQEKLGSMAHGIVVFGPYSVVFSEEALNVVPTS